MSRIIEVTKTLDEDLGCLTCRSYDNISDIRFNYVSGSTVFRLCQYCMLDLHTEIEKELIIWLF